MMNDGGDNNMVDLLERVKHGIDKGVTIVSTKSKEMMETTRVCNQIAALKDQKLEDMQELGCTVYSLHIQGTAFDEVIDDKCRHIADLDQQIQEKEEQLAEIHRNAKETLGIPFCQSCGRQIGEDDRFCPSCGNRVENKE
jgi:rubrerythrin